MSDAHLLITENIDVWTSAIKKRSSRGRGSNKKIELTGIKKLRELILELAVHGKLIPQSFSSSKNDLELAKKNKQIMLDSGLAKKTKGVEQGIGGNLISKFPIEWEQCLVEDIAWPQAGFAFKSNSFNSTGQGLPIIRIRDVGFTFSGTYYDGEYRSEFVVNNGDYLISMDGEFRVRAWSNDIALLNQRVTRLHIATGCNKKFIVMALQLALFSLQGKKSYTTVDHLSTKQIGSSLIPIPSLEEQNNIISKVDELMALCDQLEQQTENSITAHQTLVESLLATLSNSESPAAFKQNWTRIAEHFDTLFTTEHSIDQLKQTVLQLAVMGKLIPQNPNDEPASVLLEKIAAEKEQLIKDKKIKKQKPLPVISDDEKLFELPNGWEWERIAEFTIVGTGSTPSRATPEYYNPADINWVTSGETGGDFIFETKEKISPKAIKETNVSIYPAGTLIVAMYGQGKTRGQITELMIDAGTNQACAAIRLIDKSAGHRKYTKLYFQKAYKELRSHSAGGAQPNLNVGKISLTVLPIPPLDEQHRIVKKVDKLMTLCDQLKARLNEAQTTQLKLANTIVDQTVN